MSENKKSPIPFHDKDKEPYEVISQNEMYTSNLLSRPHPEGYDEECIKALKQHLIEESTSKESLLIFRIKNEWLALPSNCIKEITKPTFVHRLPHTNNTVLLGITNVQGELLITISMQNLLGISGEPNESPKPYVYSMYSRNIVFGSKKDVFVFPVDEIYGLGYIQLDNIDPVPIGVVKSLKNFFTGIFTLTDKGLSVGLLDERLIINSLNENHL